MTRLAKPFALLGAAIAFLVLLAAPASAHATFEGSDPAPNSQTAKAPKQIVLRFSEPVTVETNAIRVYDGRGDAVDVGKYGRENGDSATVTVPLPDLKEGRYAVTWRVVSDDSHPIQGAFAFGVGNVTVDSTNNQFAQQLLDKQGGKNDVVSSVYAVVRFLAFTGIALLVGVSAFVVSTWPEGWASARVRRLAWFGWWLSFVTAILAIGLQGAYSSGGSLSKAFDTTVLGDVMDTRFGKAYLARALLVLAAAPVLWALQKSKARRGALVWGGALLAVAIMTTPGLAGHASTGRWVSFALPADVLHLIAMSVWFGGLTVLAIEVLRSDDVDAIEPAMDRFSRVAMTCVAVLIATGAFQSVRQVAHVSDLLDTAYGRLLLVKLGAFAAILVVASASRDIVRYEVRKSGRASGPMPLPAGPGAMRATPDLPDPEDTVRRLRSAVWYEVAFAVAVLAVTALLVNAAPARATDAAKPFAATLSTNDNSVLFDVSVTPARVGPNQVHITATKPTGEVAPLVGISATLSNPDKGIAPIDVKLLKVGGTHYQSTGVSIPFPGTWRIDIKGLVTDVDEAAVSSTFKVGS